MLSSHLYLLKSSRRINNKPFTAVYLAIAGCKVARENGRKHSRNRAELHGSKCGQSNELGSVPTRNVYTFIKSVT